MNQIIDCTTSDLDFFSPPLYQNMIESSTITLHPACLKADRIVDIQVAKSQYYVDLCKSELYVQLKIFKTNPTNPNVEELLTETDTISVVNNIMSSLFKQVDLCINNAKVESKLMYGQLAYMRDLLNFSTEKKASSLQSQGWFDDTPGEMDNVTYIGTGTAGAPGANQTFNTGATTRRKYLGKGVIELQGPLHLDFFNNGKFLIDGMDLGLTLFQAEDAFVLLGSGNYTVKIQKAGLYLKRVTPNPSIVNSVNQMLSKNKAINYNINSSKLFTKKLDSAGMSESVIVSTGKVPKTLIIALADHQSAITGLIGKNPFNYGTFNLISVTLSVSGVNMPYAASLDFDFSKDIYLSGYRTLDSANKSIFGNGISRVAYKNGFMMIIFDLTANGECDNFREIDKSGEVTVSLKFSSETTNKIALLCYTESNETIQFDLNRNLIKA